MGPDPGATHAWLALETELDTWAREGRLATFWWRDDDACRPSAALDRLLALQSRYRVPLALAVIPERLDPSLASSLQAGESSRWGKTIPLSEKDLRHGSFHPGVAVLQHGFAHRNHAGAGEKSMELGLHRPPRRVLGELHRGFARLESAFGEGFLPVLVPPWNRIATPLLPALPPLGLRGLSAFTPRSGSDAVPGLCQVNCHVDLMDWRGGRGGRDHAALACEVAGHLRARREGRVDAEEPTGC